MFATLESFSIFFFISLALIILGVIFEEKLIRIETRIARKIRHKRVVRRQQAIRKQQNINKARSGKTGAVNRAATSTGKRRIAA